MAVSNDVVIISGCRTPVGKFQGSLSDFGAPQLGAIVVREAVKRAGIDPKLVDECIMGNVVVRGAWDKIPRARLRSSADWLPEVGAMTINKVCGSGLKAVALAAQAIQTENSSIVVAGGMESMTNAPYLCRKRAKDTVWATRRSSIPWFTTAFGTSTTTTTWVSPARTLPRNTASHAKSRMSSR